MIELVLRIGFSLAVVMGLMWGLARMVRRPLGGHRGVGPLAVLNRQQLSRGAAVTVVRVADRAVILGVTDQQVSFLGEADLEEFERHAPERRDHLTVAPDLPPDDGEQLPDAHPTTPRGRLDNSLLSSRTWTSTLDFIRDRTTRR
ncbi:FliO/MopB family protein [Micromonosporaceae bacterium Da 78-11]